MMSDSTGHAESFRQSAAKAFASRSNQGFQNDQFGSRVEVRPVRTLQLRYVMRRSCLEAGSKSGPLGRICIHKNRGFGVWKPGRSQAR